MKLGCKEVVRRIRQLSCHLKCQKLGRRNVKPAAEDRHGIIGRYINIQTVEELRKINSSKDEM